MSLFPPQRWQNLKSDETQQYLRKGKTCSESTFSKIRSFWANRLSPCSVKNTKDAGMLRPKCWLSKQLLLANFNSQQLACGCNFTELKWLFLQGWCPHIWEPCTCKSEAKVCLKRSMLNSVQLEDWRVCCFLLSSFVLCPPTAHNAHWAPLHSTLMDSGEAHQVLLDVCFERFCWAAGTSAFTGLRASLLCNSHESRCT